LISFVAVNAIKGAASNRDRSNAEGPEITKQDVDNAYTETIASLDDGFFRVRLDRLTPKETEFVTVMASLGDGPYAMNDIANILGKKLSSLGPVRANTISKGMIYSTEHGFLDFSVPLFAEFMRRQP
jgi:hypothetical protein